jgi:hypothetical protein
VFASLSLGLGLSMSAGAPFAFTDADAETYVTAMSVEPNDARKALIEDLVVGLKADGIWTKLDWLCLLAAHDAQAARLNAKNTAKSLTATNSPTFTTDRGYAGNASNAFLDFGEALDAVGNSFALNSATLGAWCNQGSGTANIHHVGTTADTKSRVSARASAGNETFQINDGTNDIAQANTGAKTGHRASVRTGAAVKRSFFNGTRVADLTTASTSIATGNGCALRSNTVYTADRLACIYSGSGLTDAEAGDMHTRLSTFLTAIGAN